MLIGPIISFGFDQFMKLTATLIKPLIIFDNEVLI